MALSITRNDLIAGPAKLTFNGATWFSKDDISVGIAQDTMKIETSPHGEIDERPIDVKADVSVTPCGQWNAAFITAVWDYYKNMIPGTSIFGATDLPLVIKGSDTASGLHTVIAAAVTKLPDIILSATKTQLGGMTLTGIRGLAGTSWSVDSAFYTVATSDGSIVDTSFDAGDILTQPYTAVWADQAGFSTAFDTEDGWTVSFDLQTQPIQVDSMGTIDYKFKSINIMAKCKPIGPTAAQILTGSMIQGTGAVRGRSYASLNKSLVITGANGTAYVTIPLASLKTAGYRFGSTVLRNGEVGFVGSRPFASGVQSALYTLAVPA